MKAGDYVSTAVRDIVTQPLRCLLTVTAIALAAALLVTLVSLGVTTRNAIVSHVTQGNALSTVVVSANSTIGGGLFSSSVQQAKSDSEKLDDAVVSDLAAVPHVVTAAPTVSVYDLRRLQLQGTSVQGTSGSYVATAIATSAAALQGNKLAAGRWFDNAAADPQVVLGNGYLRAMGLDDPQSVIGRQVTFTTGAGYRGVGADIPTWSADETTRKNFNDATTELTATVVGVSAPSATDNRVYLPMAWGEQIATPRTSTPDGETSVNTIERNGYTNVLLTTDSQKSVAQVAADVEKLGLGTFTYAKQIEQLDQLTLVMWIILGSVALISVISASLGIVNTLLMSVSEQKRSIQIWRAAGATRGLISRLYILQATILSIVGACAGAAVGTLGYRLISDRIERVFTGQGFGLLVLPDVPWTILGGSIAVSVALAIVAALYPARVASRKIVDA